VIKSFAGKHAAAIIAGYAVRGLPNQIQKLARARLIASDAAGRPDDLLVPPGNRLGQHGVRVNARWRICFAWRDGDAWDVEIVD